MATQNNENIPKDVPIIISKDVPIIISKDVPIIISKDVPLIVTKDVPIIISKDVPLIVTKDVPLIITKDVPLIITKDVPIIISKDVPLIVTKDVPLIVTKDVPLIVTKDVPLIVTKDVPLIVTKDVPIIISEDVPIIISEDVPIIISEDVIEKMIIESLGDILSKKISDANIKISLSKETTSIIAKIIKSSPDFLDDIEKSMIEIIKDNKIDSNDIPNLISLIQKLYELIYKNKDIKLDNNKCAEISSAVLKFIIHTLILERKIKINEENQVVILALIDKLIDSCINLISFQNSIKVKWFYKSIFC
jgi:hypothetical protein